MKKNISVVSLSFLLLLVGCVSGSLNLVKSGNDVSYKMENIQNNGGKYIVQVWEKRVYSDKGREEIIQDMTKKGLSTEGWDKLSDKKILSEEDCKKHRYRFLSQTFYDSDGKVLFSHSYDKQEWVYIVPDSKFDSFRKEVCK